MRKRWICILGIALAAHGLCSAVEIVPPHRELYVPYEQLGALLGGDNERVLLTRGEYDALLATAEQTPAAPAPRSVVLTAAAYEAVLQGERAVIRGTLALEVLAEGRHTLELDFADVGLRRATLDGAGAAIGRDRTGGLVLFVQGSGRHQLEVELTAPVQATAALQSLRFAAPTAPATALTMAVPGDVEFRRGAAVIERRFDEAAQQTRFTLLPPAGPVELVMTLNNRLLQTRRVVIARAVIVDEVTRAYEQLHATFSMAILHRPVSRFRFALPDGFDLTDVNTPLLSHWAIDDATEPRTLEVILREPTSDTVVLTLSAIRTPAQLQTWQMPALRPLDVAGETTVVGLLSEASLELQALDQAGLLPIDNDVIAQALPPTIFQTDPGAPALRVLAAYYAPTGMQGRRIAARFAAPQPRITSQVSTVLLVQEEGLTLQGGIRVQHEIEPLFAVELQLPAAWHVKRVTDAAGAALPFDVQPAGEDDEHAIRIRIPAGVPAGTACTLRLHATRTPPDWLSAWTSRQVAVPALLVAGSEAEAGTLAVFAGRDLELRPDALDGLTPLNPAEASQLGLAAPTALEGAQAYRTAGAAFTARFTVERLQPQITAEVYTFIRLQTDLLSAHCELVYQIDRARTRELSLLLPADTPESITLRALGNTRIKEYVGAPAGERRRWTAFLSNATDGTVRLALDFEQRLGDDESRELNLPIALADGVDYQAGFVAVEGSAELDLELLEHPRPVDVGELANAEYQPAATTTGGLSAFGFVGDDPRVRVRTSRPAHYELPPAIVQHAGLVTLIAEAGISQTSAHLKLRSKTGYVAIDLPPGSTLWSMELDGAPARPQRAGEYLLLSLTGASDALRDLHVVYETPIDPVRFYDDVSLPALRLLLPGTQEGDPVTIPIADVSWQVHLPTGVRIVRNVGSLTGNIDTTPEPAAWTVAQYLYRLAGGVNLFYGGLLPSLSRAREISKRASRAVDALESGAQYYASTQPSSARRPADELIAFNAAPEEPESSPRGRGGGISRKLESERYASWALEGMRSLKITLQQVDDAVMFRSLSGAPRLEVLLAQTRRVSALSWGLATAVALLGVALLNRRASTKISYIVVVILLATIAPLVTGRPELAHVTNRVFYAACLLVPLYLAVGLARMTIRALIAALPKASRHAPGATAALLLLAVAATTVAQPAQRMLPFDPAQAAPLVVPPDATIVPYDPNTAALPLRPAPEDQVLIPYAKYLELWQRAHLRDEAPSPPARYALAGAAYEAELQAGDELTVRGALHIAVFADDTVTVPLSIAGGVLTEALLDGTAARLDVVAPDPQGAAAIQQLRQAGDTVSRAQPLFRLLVNGAGRHEFRFVLRIPLQRSGGWRIVRAQLPPSPAAALTLQVPQAATEVQLGNVHDQTNYETTADDQMIHTSLGDDGRLDVRWRPRVLGGQVDPSLTVESTAVFDVREDGQRLVWQLDLDFGRVEQDRFSLLVPADYLVEGVAGPNVRGWTIDDATSAGGQRRVDVTLLAPASRVDQTRVVLHRRQTLQEDATTTLDAPNVVVDGAALHRGVLTLRRSPRLEMLVRDVRGATRTDLPADIAGVAGATGDSFASPLGAAAFQAYRFGTVPFTVTLDIAAAGGPPSVNIDTVVRIAEQERTLETRLRFEPRRQPVYAVQLLLPLDLQIDDVLAPGVFAWVTDTRDEHQLLSLYLATGQPQFFDVIVRGVLGPRGPVATVALPQVGVLDVTEQTTTIVIQADPALDIQATDLKNISQFRPSQAAHWMTPAQRALARIAFHGSSRDEGLPGYGATLEITPRAPVVRCATITNVRITETTIEETILLDFDIRQAGIRELAFTLPPWMADARIVVPMLRQRAITPTADSPGAPVRVSLTLQDDIMGDLRVLVEHDRLLTPEPHRAPIPLVETGHTERRSVTLENAGRDELVVTELIGLEALSRQEKAWQALRALLGTELTEAYLVTGDAPRLTYATQRRDVVATAGARIGLAEAVLAVDAHGTYRARQIFHMHNTSEAYLEVELPAGAELWTVRVDQRPVKPARTADGEAGRVRIPLIKTAAGAGDYAVVLHYGGQVTLAGAYERLRFPLVRSVNIAVELSQVRLHLPESYNWLDFDGTMTQVAGEPDLIAGHLRYQTQLAERLTRTMQSDSAFERLRAASSFREMQGQNSAYRVSVLNQGYEAELHPEILSNNEAFNFGAAQLQQLEQQPAAGEALADNRTRMFGLYDQQQTQRARNYVQLMPGNFDAAQGKTAADDGKAAGDFDTDWLETNALRQTAATQADKKGRLLIAPRLDMNTVSKAQPPASAPALEGAIHEAQMAAGGRGRQRQQQARSAEQTADLYARRLEDRRQDAAGAARGIGAPTRDWETQAPSPLTTADIADGDVTIRPETMVVGGLASLDVDFPTRGQAFFFTTPRGDVEITAHAVQADTVESFEHAGLVLAVLIVLIAGRVVATRGGWRVLSPAGPGLLIVLGLASLVTGVLPIAGIVVCIVGLVLRSRRAARAAASS